LIIAETWGALMPDNKKKHSFTDDKGCRWVACSECERGGNGINKNKCSSGWQIKRFNKLGCFAGEEINKESGGNNAA
jgi:hypothetical protein